MLSRSPVKGLLTSFEELGYKKVVGIDEVGRGALAGPMVVAAVQIPFDIQGVKDSKLLTRSQREELVKIILKHAQQISLAQVSHQEIDDLGVTKALKLAYQRCLENISADLVLTDNFNIEGFSTYIKAVKGDNLFFPVSASSIVAKVYRDQIMRSYHHFFPHYDWENNVGYGTKKHLNAIQSHGLSSLHRRSFCH